jgi:hypothetical protein
LGTKLDPAGGDGSPELGDDSGVDGVGAEFFTGSDVSRCRICAKRSSMAWLSVLVLAGAGRDSAIAAAVAVQVLPSSDLESVRPAR